MTRRHSPIALMATMLAFLAVLGMGGLGGWHAATFHDETPVRTATVAPVHVDDAMTDGDSTVVHVAAHAVSHAFDVPSHAAPTVRRAGIAPPWRARESIARADTDPSSPRRPPRG